MESRTWRRLFTEGSLPESHVKPYEAAKVKGNGRVAKADLDKIVNEGIGWVVLPNRKVGLSVSDSAPCFKEFTMRVKRETHGQYREGHLLEVATNR